MTRSVVIRAIAVVAVAAFTWLAGARDAAADDPRERPCQPDVEAQVRVALPAASSVRCPVTAPVYRIVNGQSVLVATDSIAAAVVLPDGRLARVDVKLEEGKATGVLGVSYRHSDLTGSSGKGMALLFWAFALAAVVGAVFVVTRRNLIAAVMGMVGSFLGIAAIYMLLYAQFLAVIQMLVYAGAIMVLFVFVVMILNRPEDEPVAPSGRAGQAFGGLAILYLVGRLIIMLIHVEPENREVAMNAPQSPSAQCTEWRRQDNGGLDCVRSERVDWGSVKAVGTDLFGPGLFPFEAISILLLVAVVGAIAIARPLRQVTADDTDNDARPEGGTA
jgi:NADH-quinone oxidoreductase subunit J